MESAFAIIAEPSRRAMLNLLASSERTVGELERQLGLAQPSVSKHLRVLREVGLVRMRPEGRQKFYQTNAAAIRPLHEWTGEFERFWRQTLNRVKERAESKMAKARNQEEEL